MGVYFLTSTAIYSQTKSMHHLATMNKLAAESASLSLVADGELLESTELQSKSAIDSEEGLALQSESIELELDAERETAKAMAETVLAEEYLEEAEVLHEKSAQDILESESLLEKSEGLRIQAEELHIQAEKDRAAAGMDEAQSVALLEEASKAENLAVAAEEKAGEYAAIVELREGQSVKDGKAVLKSEVGAAEDVEVMAACTPIPLLNVFCDAVGLVIESGYQSVAA